MAADIFKSSSLQQKYSGFEINQQIVYNMQSLANHGYAGIQKINTLMNIPNRMTVITIKTLIAAVNVVDIIVYERYWDNKITVCRTLSKTSGNPVTEPKEKRKMTSLKVSSYRHHNWSTLKLWRCS